MNEQLHSTLFPAPITSPNDNVSVPASGSGFAVAFSHFLSFGFVGQLAFTLLEYGAIERASPSLEKQSLLLLLIPMVCAIAGLLTARWKPLPKLGHPFLLLLIFLAIGALGLYDLYLWSSTWLADFGG
ncbi:hypothetical protein IAD21_06202 [Abditibacteriota bacterium]|nr:hypothetical protein IAD21_06202 [Abditibacteriota bacterium]